MPHIPKMELIVDLLPITVADPAGSPLPAAFCLFFRSLRVHEFKVPSDMCQPIRPLQRGLQQHARTKGLELPQAPTQSEAQPHWCLEAVSCRHEWRHRHCSTTGREL
jgi:hypothetical protein